MPYASPLHIDSTAQCYFYHTTDLPGHEFQKGGWDLRGRFKDYVGGLDVTGMRVLDVGTASGFLSFAAEEAGAREVVSFDLDTADRQHLLPFAGGEYMNNHAEWSRKQTAAFQLWKNAYWFTHRVKRSKNKVSYGDVYNIPKDIGKFDLIIMGAIIEHLGDPIRALASVSKVASKYIVVNTDYIDSMEPIARFNGCPDSPHASYIFWTYSLGTYDAVMKILGFEMVTTNRIKLTAIEQTEEGLPIDQDRVALVYRRKS